MFRIAFLVLALMFAAPLRAEVPVVLVVGDSLSAAYGIDSSDGWVSLLARRLDEHGHPHRVVNASITGDTTRSGAERLPRALRVHAPAVVILELGGNDGLRGYPVGEIRSNLERMIEDSRAAGAGVVLVSVTIPPNYGPAYRRRFERVFDELAERYDLPVASFDIAEVADTPGLLQADGIHPTAAAQPLMLDRIWPRLVDVLGEPVIGNR